MNLTRREFMISSILTAVTVALTKSAGTKQTHAQTGGVAFDGSSSAFDGSFYFAPSAPVRKSRFSYYLPIVLRGDTK